MSACSCGVLASTPVARKLPISGSPCNNTPSSAPIVNPTAKLVNGFEPLMPVYLNQLSEEQVNALLTYVRDTLGKADAPTKAPAAPATAPATASPQASESKGR